MSLPDFTTIVAVDAEHLPELAAAWPTWAKWRPEIMEGPVMIVADVRGPHAIDLTAWNEFLAIVNRRLKLTVVECVTPLEWTQRERMLTALVACVENITTSTYLKLDTDTIAAGTGPGGKWWEDEWFTGDAVLTASAWGYTRPPEYLDRFDEWWDSFPHTGQTFKLDRHVVGGVAKHPRIISYAMWGRTDWTFKMWRMCDGRMPCPSQDTFLHACSVRGGWPIIRTNQKKYGWKHCGSSLKRVRERAAEALK